MSIRTLAQEPVQCEEVYTVQAGPDDSLCCPSQQVIKTFELQGEQLVEVSSQIVEEPSSSPQLAGPVWLWQQTLMNNGDQFTPDNPGNYNVQFMPDGAISVQADCNQVSGSYTLDGSQVTIGFVIFSLFNVAMGISSLSETETIFQRSTLNDRRQLMYYGLSILLILLSTEMRIFQRILGLVSLSGSQWLLCIGLAFGLVLVYEVMKFFLRRGRGHSEPVAATPVMEEAPA